eukprot:TRINITY_DN2589_c0_g1_i1.p1 TRINITY_DN2589_c0_g1~~TRINITY_DN2589_c0_g1_i1.p1  ORF type:complete len:299 (-),score=53.57 TRINITY_DN2589_c0_g1_i1:258-1154(-)
MMHVHHTPAVFHFQDESLSLKRLGDSADVLSFQNPRPMFVNLQDVMQRPGSSVTRGMVLHPGASVSTGLRLAFEDEHAHTAKPSLTRSEAPPTLSFMADDLSSHLQKQKQEMDRFLRLQADQLRQALEEKTQKNFQSLLSLVEENFLRRMREKDLEIEKVNVKNRELEEQVKQLKVEACIWQSKAKNNEALIQSLRKGLQQAVGQARDQTKEGCGDSEAGDAESAYLDPNAEMQRLQLSPSVMELRDRKICKFCNKNSISVLLLPCRHLCLCKDCDAQVDSCPLCFSIKNASIEVFMS